MIEDIRCPHCQASVVLDSSLRGQEVSCPWCAQGFRMPGAPGEPPVGEEPVPTVAPTPAIEESSIRFDEIAPMPPVEPAPPSAVDVTPEPPVVEEPEAPADDTVVAAELEPAPEPPAEETIRIKVEDADGKEVPPPPKREPPPPAGYDLAPEEPVTAEEEMPPPSPPPLPGGRETLPCPHCAGIVLVTPQLLGRYVSCPHCRRYFLVPMRREEPPPMTTRPSPLTSRPSPAVQRLRSSEVSDNLLPAILVTIFCLCLPLGIPAIIYAAEANRKKAAGNLVEARKSADLSVKFTWAAFVFGVTGILFVLLLKGCR